MTSDDARMLSPEEREMTDHEAAEYLASCDAELVLITDYLAGALDAGAKRAVERRLDEDQAFFEKAWPSIQVWNHPVRYSELFAQSDARPDAPASESPVLTDEQTERMYHAVRANVGLPERVYEEPKTGRVARSKPAAAPVARIGSARWWRQRSESPRWLQAAGILWLLLNLAGVTSVGYLMFRDVQTERARPPRPMESSKSPILGYWKTTDSARRVVLSDSTIMILAPGSEVTQRATRGASFTPTVLVRGHVEIENTRSLVVNVIVPTGRAVLPVGRFTISATDSEAVVSAQRGGIAMVYGPGGAYARPAKIGPGETARVRRGQRSEVVPADSSNVKRP